MPAGFGDKHTLKFLLENGADVTFHSKSRVLSSPTMGTPLMWAAYAEAQDPELITMLIDKGADVNAQTAEGHTAISRAKTRGNTAVVATLLKAGAINVPDTEISSLPPKRNGVFDVRSAVERSITLLLSSSAAWYKNRTCVSCHNQVCPRWPSPSPGTAASVLTSVSRRSSRQKHRLF